MPKPPLIAVLHLVSSLPIGGVEWFLIRFLQNAQNPRFQFSLCVLNDDYHPKMRDALGQPSHISSYFLERPRASQSIRYFFQLLTLIRQNHIQVIHCHGGNAKFWALLCKLFMPKLVLVYTLHDTTTVKNSSAFHHWLHQYVFSTTAVSNHVYQDALTHRWRSPHLIEHGIPLANYPQNVPTPSHHPESPVALICIGRFDGFAKGHDVLIDALQHLKASGYSFHCSFVGTRSETDPLAADRLYAMVNEQQLSDEITILFDQENIPDLLAQSDIFVFPSRHEGFGLVVVEAIAMGLPCVVSDIPGPADIIRPEVEGLHFQSGNAEDLAHQLKRLIDSPNLRAHMSQNAYRRSKAYAIEVMLDKYYAFYEQLFDAIP